MQLTQKETELLKDLKGQEKLCVDKYTQYAESATDPQLKNLFTQIASVEQQHLKTINQIKAARLRHRAAGLRHSRPLQRPIQ